MSKQTLWEVFLKSSGAGIDSRTIEPGQVFFALPGNRTDGAEYASQALEKGAILAVLPKVGASPEENGKYCKVDDVLMTMQELARDYRRHLNAIVMAITGSNGKTTNKNLLATSLATKFRVHSTGGNFNNHIGLPLTILNAPIDTGFLLLEMGTNHFGEIKNLCSIAEPDYGSILNVGKTHLEYLRSVEGVLKAKSELADYLSDHSGKLFLNGDEKSIAPLKEHSVSTILFDRNHLPHNDYSIEVGRSVPDIVLRLESKAGGASLTLHSSLWGEHNVTNLIHALSVGSYFGLDMPSAVNALSRYTPRDNRSQIITWKGHEVYLDAYNANPTSMTHAIRNFGLAHPNQGILVLGDMGELGEKAKEEHIAILKLIDQLGFTQVWLIGDLFREAGINLHPHFNFYPDVTDIREEEMNAGEPILVKGSRSMALERLTIDQKGTSIRTPSS